MTARILLLAIAWWAAAARAADPVPTPAWAARYRTSGGFDTNTTITLSPSMEWGEGRSSLRPGKGRIEEVEENHLRLHPGPASSTGKAGSTAVDVYVVVWGERRYLLRESEVVPFVRAVNSTEGPIAKGRTQLEAGFPLRDGDEKLPASGHPALPAVLVADDFKVTAVNEESPNETGKPRTYLVTLNRGAAHCVLKGTRLAVVEPAAGGECEVIAVDDGSCTAKLVVAASGDVGANTPAVGWKLAPAGSRSPEEKE